MGKRITFSSIAVFVLILVFTSPAYSYNQRLVLGVSTGSAVPQIPPTTEGPGLILPDSPFFFLDEIKQAVRLFFAFTPEAKAQVHTAIAGERLAELRFMLARQNQNGIQIDLQGISDNLRIAASDLTMAQLSGRNVSAIAQEINDNIKRKQEVLDILESQSSGELKAQVEAVQTSLFDSKIKVENALPQSQISTEITYDLNRQIQERVTNASNSANELTVGLDELNKEASDAAKEALKNREEVLNKAIEEKNGALKRVDETLLEQEKAKQKKLLEVQGQAAERAKEAVEKAQEAAIEFEQTQQEVDKIEQQTVGGNTSHNSSGGESNSSPENSGGKD